MNSCRCRAEDNTYLLQLHSRCVIFTCTFAPKLCIIFKYLKANSHSYVFSPTPVHPPLPADTTSDMPPSSPENTGQCAEISAYSKPCTKLSSYSNDTQKHLYTVNLSQKYLHTVMDTQKYLYTVNLMQKYLYTVMDT